LLRNWDFSIRGKIAQVCIEWSKTQCVASFMQEASRIQIYDVDQWESFSGKC